MMLEPCNPERGRPVISFLISMRRTLASFVIPPINMNVRKSISRQGPSSNLKGNSSRTRNAELLACATCIPKTWLIDLFSLHWCGKLFRTTPKEYGWA